MSICTDGKDGKGCNYAQDHDAFRHGCAYESRELKMFALTHYRCPKFSPFMQPNGDTTEQIINFSDFDAIALIKKETP